MSNAKEIMTFASRHGGNHFMPSISQFFQTLSPFSPTRKRKNKNKNKTNKNKTNKNKK